MRRGKEIWKKGDLKTKKKNRPVFLERNSRWSLSSEKNVVQARNLKTIPWDTLATVRSIGRDCAATLTVHSVLLFCCVSLASTISNCSSKV